RRPVGGKLNARSVVVRAGQADRVHFAPPLEVERPVADDRHEPRQRLAPGRIVGAGVVPDVDVGLLHDFLGDRTFTDDTQGDPVQMRRREPVQLLECKLVGQRYAREQRGKAGAALRWRRRGSLTHRGASPRTRPFCHSTSGAPPARFSTRASTNGRSGRLFRYTRTGTETFSVPASATTARSARRHTVRATCASAAARIPPGRMNSLSRGRSSL